MGEVAELRIAQEEHTPYFLLWGRRDRMCTKPTGAKTSEGMYSWTSEFIEEQVALISRTASREVMARTMKRFGRQHRSSGSVPVP